MMVTKNCREQNNATEADMESIMDGKVPETTAAKCTMTCTMKEFKIVISFHCSHTDCHLML